jgi:uncharacterized membrane protein YfcA
LDWSFYAAAAPAVVLFGLSKAGLSGLGALGVPIMALRIPPVQAAAVTLPILIAQDWVGVYAFRREADWRNLAILLPAALVGVLLAYFMAAQVSEDVVRLAIGVISVGFVALTLIKDRFGRGGARRAEVAPGLFWGAIAGFASFVSHSGGPPFLVYIMPQRLKTTAFAGTSVLFFAVVNLMKVPPYVMLGEFSRANLTLSLTLLPLAVASTLAGVWLVRRVPAERFYNIVLVVTFGLGVKLMWDAARGLLGLAL